MNEELLIFHVGDYYHRLNHPHDLLTNFGIDTSGSYSMALFLHLLVVSFPDMVLFLLFHNKFGEVLVVFLVRNP